MLDDDPLRLLDQILNDRRAAKDPRAARRQCDAEGHRYQIAGRLSPTQVRCSRCRCTWAIGPKTEPADA